MTGPDEKWLNGDTGQPYWRPSTVGEPRTEWVVIHGETAPTPEAVEPASPEPTPAAAATPQEPIALPLSRTQRLRVLIEQVRSGDRSAVDALREALGGTDAD